MSAERRGISRHECSLRTLNVSAVSVPVLFHASYDRSFQAFSALKAAGGNLDAKDKNGYSPLIMVRPHALTIARVSVEPSTDTRSPGHICFAQASKNHNLAACWGLLRAYVGNDSALARVGMDLKLIEVAAKKQYLGEELVKAAGGGFISKVEVGGYSHSSRIIRMRVWGSPPAHCC